MGTISKFGAFLTALSCSKLLVLLAPQVGLEPTTLRLTARHLQFSALLMITLYRSFYYVYEGPKVFGAGGIVQVYSGY